MTAGGKRRATAGALCAAIALCGAIAAAAQPSADRPDFAIDAAKRAAVIDKVLRELNDSYVFPETAKRMEAAVRGRLTKKEYDTLGSAAAFASKLTADLQEVSKDKHLRVRHLDPAARHSREGGASMAPFAASDDYGFHRVERLAGNVGYIDLRMFFPPELGADKVTAAMNFVADTDALIFDLRQNGGGSPEMVALITSYLFDEKPVHLNDFAGRDGKIKRSYWTRKDVPGRRFTGKDVYVLTSSATFSAAEEFAYNLTNLKRAMLVGETTGGGANPVDMLRLEEGFAVSIPVSRAVNPITKTNWEGVGVKPDVNVAAPLALKTAHAVALQKLSEQAGDPARADALNRALQQTQKELEELKTSGGSPAATR